MKRHLRILSLLLVVALVAALGASCAKPPKAEMDAAEAAVTNLGTSADVQAYAPEALQRARSLIDQMRTEAKGRHYDKARNLAQEALSAAETAVADAQAAKERAKADAEQLIAAVKKALPETQKLIAQASRIAKAGIDRAARTAELEGAKAALAEAEAALAKGDYLAAVDKAGDAQKTLADMDGSISAAVQAATRKK